MNIVQRRENDCRKICLKVLEDSKVKKFLNYKGINLNDAYYKTLLYLFSSKKILLINKKTNYFKEHFLTKYPLLLLDYLQLP